MPKYCSIGTVGVRQTKEAGSQNVQREVFFNPDSDHTITHKGVRYAVFVSERCKPKMAIIHELEGKTGAVIEAEETAFTVAPHAAVCGTPVALEVEFVNAKAAAEAAAKAEEAKDKAEAEAEKAAKAEEAADTKGRLRLVGITAPAP